MAENISLIGRDKMNKWAAAMTGHIAQANGIYGQIVSIKAQVLALHDEIMASDYSDDAIKQSAVDAKALVESQQVTDFITFLAAVKAQYGL